LHCFVAQFVACVARAGFTSTNNGIHDPDFGICVNLYGHLHPVKSCQGKTVGRKLPPCNAKPVSLFKNSMEFYSEVR
jgi:hypothetical protein